MGKSWFEPITSASRDDSSAATPASPSLPHRQSVSNPQSNPAPLARTARFPHRSRTLNLASFLHPPKRSLPTPSNLASFRIFPDPHRRTPSSKPHPEFGFVPPSPQKLPSHPSNFASFRIFPRSHPAPLHPSRILDLALFLHPPKTPFPPLKFGFVSHILPSASDPQTHAAIPRASPARPPCAPPCAWPVSYSAGRPRSYPRCRRPCHGPPRSG